jgi:hypothetical protein
VVLVLALVLTIPAGALAYEWRSPKQSEVPEIQLQPARAVTPALASNAQPKARSRRNAKSKGNWRPNVKPQQSRGMSAGAAPAAPVYEAAGRPAASIAPSVATPSNVAPPPPAVAPPPPPVAPPPGPPPEPPVDDEDDVDDDPGQEPSETED